MNEANAPRRTFRPTPGHLACVIGPDGGIARGYRITECTKVGTGCYEISWQDELQGNSRTSFSCVVGAVLCEEVEPGLCTVGLLPDPHTMRVRTYAVDGSPADRPFHLSVFRD